MSQTSSEATSTRIQTALKKWQGALDPADKDLFAAFVTEAIHRIKGTFLQHHGTREALQRLELAFLNARVRIGTQINARLVEGDAAGVMAITNMPDQPFIVDTARLFVTRAGAEFGTGFNFVFRARRDASGRLVAVGDGDQTESVVLLETLGGDLADDLAGHAATLATNLGLAQRVVRDFRPMTRLVERWADKLESQADAQPVQGDACRETSAFLRWLLNENFVFMGVRESDGEPHGIEGADAPFAGSPDGDWADPHEPHTVRVRKSPIESRVHRAGRIDEILVTNPGDPEGPSLFLRGMFTYRAVTQPSRTVPILRNVLKNILLGQSVAPGSFRYKGIANVFDSLPTEFMFTASPKDIAGTLELVFDAEQRADVGVTVLKTTPFSAFCLVAMPKGSYGEALRVDLQQHTVKALGATYSDSGVYMGRFETVLLYFYLTGVKDLDAATVDRLGADLRDRATPWTARLWDALAATHGEEEAERLAEAYARSFPEAFTAVNAPDRAVKDIALLESLSEGRPFTADVFDDEAIGVILRLYQRSDIYLSQILPVLDDFGLVVIEGYPTELKTRGGERTLDTFRLKGAAGVTDAQLTERAPLLVEALEAVFRGDVASDPLNALVLTAALSWKQVDVLRAYLRYGRQLQIKLSQARAFDLLKSMPKVASLLVALFEARLSADLTGDRAAAVATASEALEDALRKLRTHDEDLLVRTLANLVHATIRTNAWRTDRKSHYLSFKLDCAKVTAMVQPRPMFEIYVHSADVEGVHLRFGKVARGGIRWSDREDFRTEVLGLARTQVVKNVPA
jgi:glutamate dehydrogenase